MASMREIKRRRNSIQSTGQITKAMKLVSTVKLQKARQQAEKGKAYFQKMYQTVCSILSQTEKINHCYLQEGSNEKKGIILISANRGLAGGYSGNVAKKLIDQEFPKEEVRLYAIGKKAKEYLETRGYEVAADYSNLLEKLNYEEVLQISEQVLSDYRAEKIGELYLAYTDFRNSVSVVPTILQLLPITKESVSGLIEEGADKGEPYCPMNYSPDEETVLEYIIPNYLQSLLFGAMESAIASENSARMQTMDNATKNAETMIERLSLEYNRARQHSITQELTEIIAGADAIC